MKKLSLLIISTICLFFVAIAQNGKVVLCEDYNKTTGAPIGIATNWDINSKTGSYVYIIYQQDKTIKESINLYVDKKNESGTYKPFETISIEESSYKNKDWFMYDLLFKEKGDYKIAVMGKSNYPLATLYTNIAYKADNITDKKKDDVIDDAQDTYYYEFSDITFGNNIDADGNVKDATEEFKLKNGKADFYCVVMQDDALKSKSIIVSIYYGDDYKEKVSEETFSVDNLDWNWVKLPISVSKVGKYVVDIYNEYDTFINSGYFEVVR